MACIFMRINQNHSRKKLIIVNTSQVKCYINVKLSLNVWKEHVPKKVVIYVTL